MEPRICRIVEYRSRTGNYTVPAIITCTTATLAPKGVEVFEASVTARQAFLEAFEPGVHAPADIPPLQGVPPLSSDMHVHLAVMTPGMPGMRADAQDFVVESDFPRSENVAGTYQEWDVPLWEPYDENDEQRPGTWAWPQRTA